VIEALKEFVTLKILDASNFCGLQIFRNTKNGTMFINQEQYIEKILNKFGMNECKSLSVPIDKTTVNGMTGRSVNDLPKVPYREAVGSLMFVAIASRPDIAFATNFLSRFLSSYDEKHWKAVKGILRYLSGTKGLGIMYCKSKTSKLTWYSDADYAGDCTTRKSTTGYVSLLAGGPVVWSSCKQRCVSLSTTESEFIAASEASKDVVWLRKLLADIGCECKEATDLKVDNQSAIKLVKNPEFHKRTKHIDVRYYFIRELYENGIVNIQYVESEKQIADILTKPLTREIFLHLRNSLNMRARMSNSGESVEII